MLWMAVLKGMGTQELGGFGREYYLAYALWANFVGRVTINWMYEFIMLDDIDTGKVNSLLVRPISFYEFYLSQFIGYKMVTAVVSFMIPVTLCWVFKAPMHLDRLPLMMALILFYLVFVHTLSFLVACMAFFMNKAYSLTGMKNLLLWVLTGELIPLDLYPEPLRGWMLHMPFAAGVYLPVGYVSGRVGADAVWQGFVSVAVGILVAGVLGHFLWRRGLRAYAGTGA